MPMFRILRHLEAEGVAYRIISHAPAFSAQKIAAAAHVSGREMAKVVMVKIDGTLAMTVIPADRSLDVASLRLALAASEAELATELEFMDRFPDCEGGGMPPFGNLYGLPVFVADTLARLDYIAFNAGNHREVIRLRYAEYARLVRPRMFSLTRQRV